MKVNKWFKKIGVITATMITMVSQTGIVATAAEIPIQSKELTIQQVAKVDDKRDNSKDILAATNNVKTVMNSDIILKLKDNNDTDEYMALTLPKGITYSQEATKTLNDSRKDLELAYDSQNNTVYAKWTEDSKRDVNISVKATKVGNYNLQAHTKRGSREVKSEITSVNVENNQSESASDSSESADGKSDSKEGINSAIGTNDMVSTAENEDEPDINDTLTDGTPIPAPPASNVNINNYFSTPAGYNSYPSSKYSNAEIITDDSPQMRGAVWSKSQIDLKKDFSTSMNLYMKRDHDFISADGIAFVLQNDPRGINAVGDTGYGIGVWSSYPERRVTNALGVEMDSYLNTNEYSADDHQMALDANHVALMTSNGSDFSSDGKQYHHNVQTDIELGLRNEWVKFVVSWDAANQNLTYQYGDNAKQIYHVDDLNSTFGGTKVYFGYTGSTGSHREHQYVSFDTLPQSSTVTAHYKDISNENKIAEDESFSGYIGEDYATKQKGLSAQHYKFVKVVGNASGKFTENDQDVTYYYKKVNPADVIVHYKDIDTGETIAPDETLSGEFGETWTSAFKDLSSSNYDWSKTDGDGTLDGDKLNSTGTFTEDSQEVTYWYHKKINDPNPEVKKSVKDLTNGNDLDKVRVGDDLEYTIDTTNTAKDSIWKDVVVTDNLPEGLDLDETSVKAYGPDGKEITGAQVSYENGQLVVSGLGDLKYDEHIKVVFTAKVTSQAIGKEVINIAEATGSTPDGSATGDNDSTITPKVPNNPNNPENPGSSGHNDGGSGITGLLPQTGETREIMLVIIGLFILLTISLIVYFKKKTERTE